MTVSSLWPMLDEASSGTPVGINEFVAVGNSSASSIETKSLAVDLSIWICEALTSPALATFHADPAAHLVYNRAVKLLKLGLRLVCVVEGMRRVRCGTASGRKDVGPCLNRELEHRRSGTAFWKACRSCEEVLHALGVPVVRAKAEGEALCALLNRRGIVDGVVSNDGDCLLFGARVVYTMLTVDNLERSKVIKYDAENLRAVLGDDDDRSDGDEICGADARSFYAPKTHCPRQIGEVVTLSRDDLISFALLTGSDLVGAGIPHVGSRKAIRFISTCRKARPLSPSSAALEELKSWSNAAAVARNFPKDVLKVKERCCTLCLHPGDKRTHEKSGCEQCGTTSGEACFSVSNDDRSRRLLRAKALDMSPPFASIDIIDLYYHPNEDEIPSSLATASIDSSACPKPRPCFHKAMQLSTIVKGNTQEVSREYVRQTLPKLLARINVLRDCEKSSRFPMNKYRKQPSSSQENITASRITKRLTHESHPCYELEWSLLGFDFCTFEWKNVVDTTYPYMVEKFRKEEAQAKQGAVAAQRRDFFLGPQLKQIKRRSYDISNKRRKARDLAPRKGSKCKRLARKRVFDEKENRAANSFRHANTPGNSGDDFNKLMRFVGGTQGIRGKAYSCNLFADSDSSSQFSDRVHSDIDEESQYSSDLIAEIPLDSYEQGHGSGNAHKFPCLSSTNAVITCDMGIQIKVTPIVKKCEKHFAEWQQLVNQK